MRWSEMWRDEEAIRAFRIRLAEAGFRGPWAYEAFNTVRVVLAIALPVLVVPLLPTRGHSYAALGGAVVVVAALGFYGPDGVVEARRRMRDR